jgi:type II secretory pathway pseudopilin PulG
LAKFNSSRSAGLIRRATASTSGFSLVEVLVATGLLATAIVSLAQIFALSTRTNLGSRTSTYATVLAQQKLEELRSLSWGFDPQGLPLSDTTTDTTVTPETAIGGTGLAPSGDIALQQNTAGYVDYIDSYGNKMCCTGAAVPGDTIYIRRWSVSPLPTNPNNTLVIQVLVTRNKARGASDLGAVGRLPEEARVITVKTRKAQ